MMYNMVYLAAHFACNSHANLAADVVETTTDLDSVITYINDMIGSTVIAAMKIVRQLRRDSKKRREAFCADCQQILLGDPSRTDGNTTLVGRVGVETR